MPTFEEILDLARSSSELSFETVLDLHCLIATPVGPVLLTPLGELARMGNQRACERLLAAYANPTQAALGYMISGEYQIVTRLIEQYPIDVAAVIEIAVLAMPAEKIAPECILAFHKQYHKQLSKQAIIRALTIGFARRSAMHMVQVLCQEYDADIGDAIKGAACAGNREFIFRQLREQGLTRRSLSESIFFAAAYNHRGLMLELITSFLRRFPNATPEPALRGAMLGGHLDLIGPVRDIYPVATLDTDLRHAEYFSGRIGCIAGLPALEDDDHILKQLVCEHAAEGGHFALVRQYRPHFTHERHYRFTDYLHSAFFGAAYGHQAHVLTELQSKYAHAEYARARQGAIEGAACAGHRDLLSQLLQQHWQSSEAVETAIACALLGGHFKLASEVFAQPGINVDKDDIYQHIHFKTSTWSGERTGKLLMALCPTPEWLANMLVITAQGNPLTPRSISQEFHSKVDKISAIIEYFSALVEHLSPFDALLLVLCLSIKNADRDFAAAWTTLREKASMRLTTASLTLHGVPASLKLPLAPMHAEVTRCLAASQLFKIFEVIMLIQQRYLYKPDDAEIVRDANPDREHMPLPALPHLMWLEILKIFYTRYGNAEIQADLAAFGVVRLTFEQLILSFRQMSRCSENYLPPPVQNDPPIAAAAPVRQTLRRGFTTWFKGFGGRFSRSV